MIVTIKNSSGFIVGYAEANKVDERGQLSKDGIYLRVENFWIHEAYRDRQVFKLLFVKLNNHPLTQDCQYIYWIIIRDNDNKKIIDDDMKDKIKTHYSKLYNKNRIINKFIGELRCLDGYLN